MSPLDVSALAATWRGSSMPVLAVPAPGIGAALWASLTAPLRDSATGYALDLASALGTGLTRPSSLLLPTNCLDAVLEHCVAGVRPLPAFAAGIVVGVGGLWLWLRVRAVWADFRELLQSVRDPLPQRRPLGLPPRSG